MNLYQIKLTDNQKNALEHLFAQGIIWSKTELSEAWDELREQVKEATNTVAIINALKDAKCNCTKASDPAMKYDPNRQFREGDIVRPRKRDGRVPWGYTCTSRIVLDTSWTLKVRKDEARGLVECENENGFVFETSPFFLELVTTVEDLGRYSVKESFYKDEWQVWKQDSEKIKTLMATYASSHPHAKAAAEAECARLNAEYRKEQSND